MSVLPTSPCCCFSPWDVRCAGRIVSCPSARSKSPLTGLLRHFGPPRRAYHPEFPFRYLASDGLWEVPEVSSWSKKHLRDRGVKGGLPEPLYRLLTADPVSARLAARRLLNGHFPVSMHQHILRS